MRCKQGDIAITIDLGVNSGKIVTCEKFLGDQYQEKDCWKVDVPMIWNTTVPGHYHNEYIYPDRHLFPIRPTDKEDEMLRIAGKPKVYNGQGLLMHELLHKAFQRILKDES